ncbi:MAG: AAA family ATPase, partial [Nitrospirae bacterium]|nr:AAA family ATPase [Nitrospirota bacterium]
DVSNNLKRLLIHTENVKTFDEDFTIKWVQKELEIEFAKNQTEAVIEALKNKVMIITGGPGTGKTTIIQAIIKVHLQSGSNVALAAPTGRAAKRMTEATGYTAKTIHRLLEFTYEAGGFKRNSDNPLECDVIVIDETSMIDTILMSQLLNAIPTNAALILVGDIDQLPSVGAGNVFRDIIDSQLVKCVRLDEIFRQSKDSLIIQNAHRVNKGEFPIVTFEKEMPQDFYFFELEEPEVIVERIVSLCKERIPQKFGYHPITDIANMYR